MEEYLEPSNSNWKWWIYKGNVLNTYYLDESWPTNQLLQPYGFAHTVAPLIKHHEGLERVGSPLKYNSISCGLR